MALFISCDVVGDAVFMRILTGKKTTAAWRTERGCNKCIFKSNAFALDTFDVRHFDKRIINLVPTKVIDQNENNIWPGRLRCAREIGGAKKKSENKAAK